MVPSPITETPRGNGQVERRITQMAQELKYALSVSSSDDLSYLAKGLIIDVVSALTRRVGNFLEFLGKVVVQVAQEGAGLITAYFEDRTLKHVASRLGVAVTELRTSVASGVSQLKEVFDEFKSNPAEAGPRLFVLVMSSLIVSGGLDGDGGAPDLDITYMGVGAHRSPLTHSILLGAALEAAVLCLVRVVSRVHKNLPVGYDPLWDSIERHSRQLLGAAGQGASIGLAYHLMVDGIVQPAPLHGLPFSAPIEAHQFFLVASSAMEASAAYTGSVNDQHYFLANKRVVLPESIAHLMSDRARNIINRHGVWLFALANGAVPPITDAQSQFLRVVAGRRIPSTEFEHAWIEFRTAVMVAAPEEA